MNTKVLNTSKVKLVLGRSYSLRQLLTTIDCEGVPFLYAQIEGCPMTEIIIDHMSDDDILSFDKFAATNWRFRSRNDDGDPLFEAVNHQAVRSVTESVTAPDGVNGWVIPMGFDLPEDMVNALTEKFAQ